MVPGLRGPSRRRRRLRHGLRRRAGLRRPAHWTGRFGGRARRDGSCRTGSPSIPAGPEARPRTFPGRIWTASGCFGYGLDGADLGAAGGGSPFDGLGAVVTKTVTPQARRGNPPPRLWETAHGALNSIGLENVGLARFADEIVPVLEARGVPFVASLAATRPEEFGDLARRLAAAARRGGALARRRTDLAARTWPRAGSTSAAIPRRWSAASPRPASTWRGAPCWPSSRPTSAASPGSRRRRRAAGA
ncbi:MAG: hypothetical protein IPI34_13435 [bacterium]|nr:hypothetical protein [bacterium]